MAFGDRKTPMKRTALAPGTKGLKRTAWKHKPVALAVRDATPKPSRAKREAETAIAQARPVVLARAGGTCEFEIPGVCQGKGQHLHHRKLRRHGDHSVENLVYLCFPCHSHAHLNPALSYEKGWLLRGSDRPIEIPWARR